MENIELEKAVNILLKEAGNDREYESVPLLEGLNRVCAEQIKAPFPQPPFSRSPLDGYAFAAISSTGASLKNEKYLYVDGEICAGSIWDKPVEKGHAVRLMTGAPIPKGCDCVLRQEDVKKEDERGIFITQQLKPYQNYCFCGEDIEKDTVLIKEKELVTAAHIGVLASMGIKKINVYRRARIGLLSTGDEIVDLGEKLLLGKIYNSNLYLIAARLTELGFVPRLLGILGDDPEVVAETIKKQADLDFILTTGGVSVGKKDIMHEVWPKLGAQRLFWRLKMKPGSPLLAYKKDNLLGIALSGNPFAALATFELVVRPVLLNFEHRQAGDLKRVKAILAEPFAKKSPGRRFVRANYDGERVHVSSKNASGMLFSAIGCNAFIDIAAGSDALPAGSLVDLVLLR